MTYPTVVSRIQNRRGTQAQFDALYPPGYTGIGGASGSGVLQPGELALCTDSRRIFIGNLNGEYVELSVGSPASIAIPPLSLILAPAASFTVMPSLTYSLTNFFTLLYDVTDSTSLSPGTIGPTFAKNGELKITAVVSPMVPSPSPPTTAVSLVDTSTVINLTPSYDISFMAQYDSNTTPTVIQILYKHNFPSNLTFSTSTIKWV